MKCFNNSHFLFVYGTLKKNRIYNHYLSNEVFLGNYITADSDYDMIIGQEEIPYVYRRKEGYHISGELYNINEATMDALDIFEKNGLIYSRELIKLYDCKILAWCYLCVEKRIMDDIKLYRKLVPQLKKVMDSKVTTQQTHSIIDLQVIEF